MKTTVLTVIQQPLQRANVRFALTRAGLDVVEALDPRSVRNQVRRSFAELVMIGMPVPGALDLCRDIRTCSDLPILMQLAAPDDHAEWMCLEAGADDVITEHTSRRVFVARINALLLRRAGLSVCPDRTLQTGPLVMDLDARTLHIDDDPVDLTRTEFDLLAQLMAQPRRVHIRGDLVQAVWGEHYPEHILETHLSRLRKKVRLAGGPQIGTAVRGIGYRLGIEAMPAENVS